MSFGVKGSIPGYNAETAADYLLAFNSYWPLLKIAYSGSKTLTFGATAEKIVDHNLGYPPFYIIIANGYISAGYGNLIGVNNTSLTYNFTAGGAGDTTTIEYYVFALPLNQNFLSPNISSDTTQTVQNDNFQFKLTKPGKDITSTDLRDFSLYSSSRSLMVSKVQYGTTIDDGLNYVYSFPHDLPYIPIGFAFMNFGNGGTAYGYVADYYYSLIPPTGVQVATYTVDSTNMTMSANNSLVTTPQTAVGVILKDPFYKETINVVVS